MVLSFARLSKMKNGPLPTNGSEPFSFVCLLRFGRSVKVETEKAVCVFGVFTFKLSSGESAAGDHVMNADHAAKLRLHVDLVALVGYEEYASGAAVECFYELGEFRFT